MRMESLSSRFVVLKPWAQSPELLRISSLAHNDASSSKYERRDEAIRAKRVRLVDPETGKLNETAESTKSLLQRIDRQNWWLVQVTEGGREEDETGARLRVADEDTPIVKLVNRKQIYERAKEKKALKKSDPGAAARSETLEKTVQITWSSTPHDVKHKLLGGKTHLWRKRVGARVVVAITSKRGKGPAGGSTPESRLKLIEEVTDLLCAPPEPNEIGRHELVQEAHVKQKGQLEWRMNGAAVDITFELASGKAK
ncbi:Translation initiation factor 3, N-terminal [Ceraceosorus bombacis]|uniref:Translation initiation factor 3, N-terminal n=1 Tax=Ceraceosorus bombacis TaxID=401625 RepID=A0A0P1BM02_9BASI|nr:Translation initiation factor 3, N-terminal [Ceraceosorus bombacis]